MWEEAESNNVKGPSFSNPNPSTLLTPSSVGTQFPTASMATKKVTFGQTAVSTANTSRSGYEANSGATPLNEGASRPSLDAPQHLPTRSYSPFTNTPYQLWLYNVDYDSMFLPRPEFPKFKGNPLEFKSFLNNFETHLEPRVHDERTLFCLLLQHCSEDIQGQINHLFSWPGSMLFLRTRGKSRLILRSQVFEILNVLDQKDLIGVFKMRMNKTI